MANNHINKAYIRQNIPEQLQQSFLNYFQSIQGNQNFLQWPLSKVKQIVNDFKLLNSQLKFDSDRNFIDQLNKSSNKEHNDHKRVHSSLKKGQYKSSINYLQQIQKSIEFNSAKKRCSFNTISLQNWFTISNLPNIQSQKSQYISQKPNNNIFDNFDQLIKPIKIEQNINPLQQSLLIKSKYKNPSQKSIKERQNIKQKQRQRQSTQSNKNIDKTKDKLYKVKISQKISCKKIKQKLLCQDVIIQNHQMVHRIFLPDYAIYHVKILPSNIICKRVYNDFICLRKVLQKMYPCTILPYLQDSSWLSQSDISLIQKNKQNLTIFIKKLISHPVILNSQPLKDFLSIPDHKNIKQKLQSFQKSQLKYLSDIQTSTGQYQLNLSQQQYKKIQKISKWTTFIQNYFINYNELLETLSSQLKNIQNTYGKLVNMSLQMQNKIKSFYQNGVCQQQIKQQFQKVFEKQEEYYYMKKKIINLEINNFNVEMIPFINDEKKNIQIITNLQEEIIKLNQKYIKRLENQPQSPSSMSLTYNDLPIKQFKDNIWSQSQNIMLFKYQISYINTNILNEYSLYNNSLIKNIKGNWNQIVQRQVKYMQVLKDKSKVKDKDSDC